MGRVCLIVMFLQQWIQLSDETDSWLKNIKKQKWEIGVTSEFHSEMVSQTSYDLLSNKHQKSSTVPWKCEASSYAWDWSPKLNCLFQSVSVDTDNDTIEKCKRAHDFCLLYLPPGIVTPELWLHQFYNRFQNTPLIDWRERISSYCIFPMFWCHVWVRKSSNF